MDVFGEIDLNGANNRQTLADEEPFHDDDQGQIENRQTENKQKQKL